MSTIIKHKEFPNYKVYKTQVAGRPLTIEVGKGKNPLPFSQLASIEFRLFPMMMRGLTVCAQLPEE